MAKQYLVDQTIEFIGKGGAKETVLRSDKPQSLPPAVAKEALALKLIREAGKAADVTATGDEGEGAGEGEGGGTGDGATGDE